MKTWDKEVQQSLLKDEKAVVRNLEKCYKSTLLEIDSKIGGFTARILENDNPQSAIYQLKYQQELKKQVESALKDLQNNNYGTINDYLQGAYTNSFLGAQYALHNQGVPLITPINQQSMIQALTLNSQISEGLYSRLGVDVDRFKRTITAEVSRGIATGSTWNQIAKQISNKGNVTYSNASRIARTEGHRIQNEAKMDAYTSAKEKGADIFKQWDSTLDGNTRDTHRRLDGQIRELDEDFEVDGMTVSAPGHFGDPSEDCNCRCCLLQRARWGLDEDELKTLQDRAEYFGLDKTKDFRDFKEKYLNAVENSEESGIIKDNTIYHQFNSGDEVNDFFYYDDPNKKGLLQRKNSTYGKWQSSLTAVQQQAITEYTTGGYADLNQFLREIGDWDTLDKDMMLDFRNDMRSVISDFELKKPIKVYRYVGKDTFSTRNLGELVGTDFIDKGFMSTSPVMNGIENAVITGKDIVLEINVPAGKGRGAYLNSLSPWEDIEYEFLLKDSTKCRITSFDNSGDKPILRMEVIE